MGSKDGRRGEGPRIAVIVCTCDRYDRLGGCLAALAGQSLPPGAREMLVIDNSTDPAERSRFLKSGAVPPGFRFIGAARPGLSRARNIGVAAAAAPLIAFTDDDALPDPDWLARLADAFDAPEVAAAGGPVVAVWPGGARPAWLSAEMEGFFSVVDRGDAARDLAEGEWLAGANVAFRRDALLAAGGFDEALGRRPGTLLGNEEIALVDRLRRAGHAIRFAPDARVRHLVDPARLSQAWLRRRVAWQAISDLLLDGGEPAKPAALWRIVSAFLQAMPPECRNLVGLTRDLDDPALVRAQSEAIGALMRLLAGHGDSLERIMLAA